MNNSLSHPMAYPCILRLFSDFLLSARGILVLAMIVARIYERNTQSIESEAALDGLYVIRTSVEPEVLSPIETVRADQSLS
ncbi:MAG: hypothetical protein HC941_28060, partial [Microcoleus sp. SU_5_3]|nr:hypothetical protein [Microcoleus sp. SU_5_3]